MPFLIALGVATLAGFLFAEPVAVVAAIPWLKSMIVAAVMFVSGATMADGAVGRSFRRRASWVAIGMNSVVMPVLMLVWLALWPFELPQSLRTGLLVASVVPCTLASAAVWTRRAGGDDSVAMVTTLVTNLACVATIPLFFFLAIPGEGAASMDTRSIAIKLAMTVALPLLAAAAVRRLGGAGWFDQNREMAKWFNQAGILVMVAFGAAAGQMASRSDPTAAVATFPGWMFVIVSVVIVHAVGWAIGVAITRKMGETPAVQIAVGFAGSQKTLLVGLQIAMAAGGSVMPMLAIHVSQLIVDTVVADRWRRRFADERH